MKLKMGDGDRVSASGVERSARLAGSPRGQVALAWALAALVSSPPMAYAVAPEGQAIDSSKYTIDLHQGPVQGGSRVVGMAGAYEAVAEGVLASQYNPAAVAVRVPWSQTWFDWELDGGLTLPASVTGFDFDNNGDNSFSNSAALFLTGAVGLQFGDIGYGFTADTQIYRLQSRTAEHLALEVSVLRTLHALGYSLSDGELVLALGLGLNRIALRHIVGDTAAGEREIGSVVGPTFHAGALWAPSYLPLRAGVSARVGLPPAQQPNAHPDCQPPDCQRQGDDYISQGFFLPRTISLPTELSFGVAFQFFRPLNFAWKNPHEEIGYAFRENSAIEGARAARKHHRRRVHARRGRQADVGPSEEQLEQASEALEAEEEERLKKAREADRQRRLMAYRAAPRERLLLALGAKVTWPTVDGVGLESFLSQQVERSGETFTVQPHGAVEAEAWPGYLVLRGGSYLEPSRFRAGSSRVHGTGGLDIRIPIEWSVFGLFDDDTTFRVSGAVDGSQRYFGWGAGLGLWR